MHTPPNLHQLRHEHYNATVTRRRQIHEELLILRVRPDGGVPAYEAGQYTTLGWAIGSRASMTAMQSISPKSWNPSWCSARIPSRRRSSTSETGP